MGLKFRANLTGFLLVASITVVISALAVWTIDDLTHSLNHRLLAMELEEYRGKIIEAVNVLEINGLSGVQGYVERAKADLVTDFESRAGGMFGELIIVSSQGTVIMRGGGRKGELTLPCLGRLLQTGAGRMECLVDTEMRIGTHLLIPEWDWLLLVTVSAEKMRLTRNEFLWRVGIVFFLASALGWLFFVRAARGIVDPVLALSNAATVISRGDWSALPEPLARRDEIGELSRNFVSMARRLRETQADLTRQADSLRQANVRLEAEIVERIRVEKDLRKAKSAFEGILDSAPSMIIGVDLNCVVTHWNRTASILTGIEPGSVIGSPLEAAMPRLAGLKDAILRSMAEQSPAKLDRVPYTLEGEVRQENILISPLVSDATYGAVIRLDDVTQRIRMEEVMIQSEKMTSLGGLAAGMAHEINNPLTGIGFNAVNIQNRIFGDLEKNETVARDCGVSLDRVRDYLSRRDVPKMLESISESGERAAKIVASMLKFSRQAESVLTPQDIAPILDSTLELAANDYDLRKRLNFGRISIIREYQADMPQVMCVGGEIQQVFFNLFKNGAQAMADKEYAQGGPEFVVRLLEEDGMARIEIKDNGPGMTEEVRRRAFEPFFTTKPAGQGTGLGLSVSYFIVTWQHGGTMEVQSMPGLWTNFIIRLPLKRSGNFSGPIES
jgi:PAS domain S-box-containing protein